MTAPPTQHSAPGRPRVVIVGGGFAGANTARHLEKACPEADIVLLSEENYITYNPLLPEVVGASLLPGHVVVPLRQLVRRSRVYAVKVNAIDTDARRVHYQGEGAGHFDYDHLVLAFGSSANMDLVPGMEQHALPLKTLGDALHMRNQVIARIEQAELAVGMAQRVWLNTFIVIGGGFSGVEVAGEISDFLIASRGYYEHMGDLPRVVLVHAGPCLLPELPPELGEVARASLARRGVEVRLQARSVSVDALGVRLEDGSQISGGTVICTIGTRPNSLMANLAAPMERGRLRTEADMSVPGLPGVWALGDCAAVPNAVDGKASPPTAQFALRQASQLAANIASAVRGAPTRPFRYRPRGQMSSVGHNQAVCLLFGQRLSGFIAWLVWRGFYLLHIPTLARKARLYLEWNWAMFFPPDITHLRFNRTPRAEERRANTD